MQPSPHFGWRAEGQRLALAAALSAAAHLAVLANLALTPAQSVSLLSFSAPLVARLAPLPAPAEPEQALAPAPQRKPAPDAQATPRQRPPQPAPAPAGVPAPEVFYKGSEVDVRAEPLFPVDLEYPEAALAAGTKGVVRLRLLIGSDGALRSVEVLESAPRGVFEEAALKAVRALRFRPALRNGTAVGSIKVIEVPFAPDCNLTGSCPR